MSVLNSGGRKTSPCGSSPRLDVHPSFICGTGLGQLRFSERLLMRWLAGLVLSLCLAFPATAAERAMLILDASGSMWAELAGVPRITTLRQTLDEVLTGLPSGLELGLMTY